MAEKKGKEEYHLPEEENTESPYEEEEYSQQSERKAFSVKNILSNKKVWVPLVIILAIYGVYKFMEYRDRAQMQIHQPEPAQQAAQPAPTQPQPVVNEPLATKQELQTAIDQVNKSQMQLDALVGQLNQVQQTQTQMNNELTELSTAVKALTGKLEEVKPVVKEKKRVVRRIKRYYGRPVILVPTYHVRAVVPGRAWIESSLGRLFTVRVGEKIVGYGTVEEIDVERGVVVTSSGREITYGKYDS